MNSDLEMDCPIEKKLFVRIEIEKLRTREIVFLTEIILKSSPNTLKQRLIEIIKDSNIYKEDLY
jgi:hypothetical protein